MSQICRAVNKWIKKIITSATTKQNTVFTIKRSLNILSYIIQSQIFEVTDDIR